MASKPISVHVYGEDMSKPSYTYVIENSPLGEFCPPEYPFIIREFATGSEVPEKKILAKHLFVETDEGVLEYTPSGPQSTSEKDARSLYTEVGDLARMKKKFPDMFKWAEDSVRLTRAFIPHGNTYGGAHKKAMRIMIVPQGTVVEGMVVWDGTVLLKEGEIEDRGNPIEMEGTFNHYSIWQSLDFDSIREDVDRRVEQWRTDISKSRPEDLVNSKILYGIEDSLKKDFLEIEPQLSKHPFFSQGASDDTARYLFGHMFGVYGYMQMKMLVAFDKWTLPEGRYIVYRHPVISSGSVKAIEITGKNVGVFPKSVVGGAVVTVTGFWDDGSQFTIKGAGPIMTKLPKGVDMVTCDKNIKIGKRIGPITATANAYITIIQRHTVNGLVGMPMEALDGTNADCDGDPIGFTTADDIPQIFKEVQRVSSVGMGNCKFARSSHTPWTDEAVIDVLYNAMGASMGLATNLRNWWWSMNEESRINGLDRVFPAIAELKAKLRLIGTLERSLAGVDRINTLYIQHEIESIKNLEANTELARVPAAKLQSAYTALTTKNPAYTGYKRSPEALKIRWPVFLSDWPKSKILKFESTKELRKTWEWKDAIPDACNGTPVQLFMRSRNVGKSLWKLVVKNPDPLTTRTFTEWAPVITGAEMSLGQQLVDLYETHISTFDKARRDGVWHPERPEEVHIYRSQWASTCKRFAKDHFHGDMQRATYALWRASHNDGRTIVSGAAFVGFFNETKKLVQDWTCTLRASHCLIIGAKYNFVGKLPAKLSGYCTIVLNEKRVQVIPLEDIEGLNGSIIGTCAKIEKEHAKLHHSWPKPNSGYKFHMELAKDGETYNAMFEPAVLPQ